MGNRAVITTRKNFENDGIGVYLHWNGGRDSVAAFLKYCELKGYRAPSSDNYGWARLTQVIANFFGGSTSIGVDRVSHLDCDNYDNGVYIIDGWEIVDREYFSGTEQDGYPLDEMLKAIDERQPVSEQLGDYLTAKEVPVSEINIGDTIYYKVAFTGEIKEVTVEGFGDDVILNGINVKGMPFVPLYGLNNPAALPMRENPNNYITDKTVKVKG